MDNFVCLNRDLLIIMLNNYAKSLEVDMTDEFTERCIKRLELFVEKRLLNKGPLYKLVYFALREEMECKN